MPDERWNALLEVLFVMLKRRLIACLVMKNGIIVQSINFRRYLPVGSPEVAVEFLNQWGIDEIILLDIDATKEKRGPAFERVRSAAARAFVPLTVGGGIRNIDDVRELIHSGADKVCLNSAALTDVNIIREVAKIFGQQCIVVSVDCQVARPGEYSVYRHLTGNSGPWGLIDYLRSIEDAGAGEIFLNSVDRDGAKQGYDIALLQKITETVSIPVIACGGVGDPEHFVEALSKTDVSAVAAGNFFHFTEHSAITAKAFMEKHGNDVRLDTYATYRDFDFDPDGRISKRDDSYLDELRFFKIAKEVI